MNFGFLKKYNLVSVTLTGLLLWFFLIFIFPLKIKYELNFLPILYIVLNYFFFILGIKSITTLRTNKEEMFSVNILVLKKIMYFVIILALTGFLLKILDKFYLRDTSFSNTMSENRILLSNSGPSIVSIFSAVTNPLSFIPLFIYYYINQKNTYLFLVCIFLFFSASLEFIILGSRSGIFILLILFGLYLIYFKRLRLSLKQIIIIGIVLFSLGIYSINLFITRTTDFTGSDKRSIEHILTRANYNFTLEPTEETRKSIITSKNKIYQSSYLGALNFVQYYVHGVYEFGYLYNNYEGNHHFGLYTFNVFAKFSNIIFKTNFDLQEVEESPPRIGVYTTFFGPIYLDFGWLSLVFMFFFGAFQKTIYNKVLQGRIQFIPLLFYFLIINFFFPVINFINGAQGLYTMFAFILFALIYKFLSAKIIISKNKDSIRYVKILKSSNK